MDVNNGEILSLVSLTDFNQIKRKISDVNYINRATKGFMNLVRYLKHLWQQL